MASMVDCGYFASGEKLEKKKVEGYMGRASKESETEEVIGGG